MQSNKLARPNPWPADGEAAAVAAVLGNDDLLPLILIHLGFPTSLVRAALVCRRWYCIASHPDFLHRFRQLHPPRVLGFYGDLEFSDRPKFVPLADAPELATAVRLASTLDCGEIRIHDCRDGRLLFKCLAPRTRDPHVVRPLHPTRGFAVLPLVPLPNPTDDFRRFLLQEDGSEDGVLVVRVVLHGTRFVAKVRTFQSGVWRVRTTRANDLLLPDPEASHSVENMEPPVRGKIYMKVNSRSILQFDLVAANVSVIQLPENVDSDNYKLSCGEDLGLFLVHADGSLLSIWRHETSGNGSHHWVLVDDAIRVHEAYNRHDDVTVFVVDSNLEYVFLGLKTTGILISIHLKSRTEKVYGEIRHPHLSIESRIVPFMMIWPPIFPALREENL